MPAERAEAWRTDPVAAARDGLAGAAERALLADRVEADVLADRAGGFTAREAAPPRDGLDLVAVRALDDAPRDTGRAPVLAGFPAGLDVTAFLVGAAFGLPRGIDVDALRPDFGADRAGAPPFAAEAACAAFAWPAAFAGAGCGCALLATPALPADFPAAVFAAGLAPAGAAALVGAAWPFEDAAGLAGAAAFALDGAVFGDGAAAFVGAG